MPEEVAAREGRVVGAQAAEPFAGAESGREVHSLWRPQGSCGCRSSAARLRNRSIYPGEPYPGHDARLYLHAG